MNSSAKRSVIWARRSAPRWCWSATGWDFTRNSREAQSLLLNLRNVRQPTNATFANGWVIKVQAATFADARPKGRVMLYANALKFAGALGMCLHLNPFISYALVGAGAAANSPAKYGILGELVTPAQLVKANSLLEASTIAAILIGAVAGGTLTDWSIEG